MADGGERSRYIRHVRAIEDCGVQLWRPLDHDNRQAKPPRRFDLAVTSVAAGVLGNHSADTVFLQHADLFIQRKGAARRNVASIRHLQRRLYRINAANEIAVLGCGLERKKFLPAEPQKHSLAFNAERDNSLFDGIDPLPFVIRLALPGGARKCYKRNFGKSRRLHGIGGNPRRIGMGGVDQNIEIPGADEIRQTRSTAEPATAHRHRLFHWRKRTTGHGEQDSVAGVHRQLAGENAGIRRATKDEYGACHDV